MLLSSFFTGHHGTELGWWMRAPCIRWNYQSHWQAMCTTSVKASIGQFHSINTLQTNEPESFKLPGHTKNNWQGRVEVVEVMEDAFLDISSDFKTCVCFWCDFEAILRRKYKSTTPKFWTLFIWDKNRKRKKKPKWTSKFLKTINRPGQPCDEGRFGLEFIAMLCNRHVKCNISSTTNMVEWIVLLHSVIENNIIKLMIVIECASNSPAWMDVIQYVLQLTSHK